VRLKKKETQFIEWERVCRVATAGASGWPHGVPVCHVLWKGKIYFGSGNDAKKVLNLKANPRVAVSVDLYSDAWEPQGRDGAGDGPVDRARAALSKNPGTPLPEVPAVSA